MFIDRTQPSLAHVRNVLGSKFADKATDEFCQAFALPSMATAKADDGFPQLMPVVVELVPQPALLNTLDEAVGKIRSSPAWNEGLNQTLRALGESIGGGPAFRGERLIDPTALLRRQCVKNKRESYHRMAAPIHDALERAVSRSSGPSSPDAFEPPVQFCWSNQTFLVAVDPRELAALADDPLIHQIDMPRPVQLQIDRTGDTVGATQFRRRFPYSGKDVVVAVIDSEVALLHNVFQDRVRQKRNFTREAWGRPGKHGTTVAGVIAGNGLGVQGMAPDAIIYNYKVVMTDTVSFPIDPHVAMAIDQALEDGADIANCSVNTTGRPDGTSREARACDTAWECGMTVVVSTGNRGPAAGSVRCPADANGAIAVGATSVDGGTVEGYSGRGPSLGTKTCPDLVAPGGSESLMLRSFLPQGVFGDSDFGTSLAAAHISGLLALLLEAKPGMTPNEQLELLQSRCKPFVFGAVSDFGKGLPSLADFTP